MTDDEIKLKIKTISDEKYSGSYRHLKPKLLKQIVGEDGFKRIHDKVSKDLHTSYSLVIHCFMNDVLTTPVCICGKQTKFNTTTKLFMKYCSTDCKWSDNENVQKIKRQTCIDKYGNVNVLASDYGKAKAKNTLIEKYGVDNYTKTDDYKQWATGNKPSEESINKMKESQRISYYNSLKAKYTHCTPLFTLDEYEGVKGYKRYDWLCHTCNKEFTSSCDNGSSPICDHCKPIGTKHELLIRNYLDTLGVDYLYNWRGLPSKKEIDIYMPDLNIGIEVCGLYWHSTAVPSYNKNDHISKHNECESVGIRLITIFDDEIYNKKRIVLNRIKNIVTKSKRKIYARKCVIRELDTPTIDKFLNKYHIQGTLYGCHRYGLFYNNRLVSVMTFNNSRYTTGHKTKNENVYELGRYATVSNFSVIGGAGKLFKHFIKTVNPDSIYSYSDKRWNTGGVYSQIGMTYSKDTVSNYFYTKTFKERLSRIKFQKSKLKHFNNYSDDLTEEEIMKSEKYYRTYDCGSKLYIWNKD